MPSPVDFTVSLAPFPATGSYTPAELAQAIVARLTISPAEPWSSFQNGGTIPTSDVGPVLYQGMEWRVWNPALGAYTYHRQNGAGIVSGTVPFTALAQNAVTGGVMTTNSGGNPTLLAPATNGQVLTLVGGVPTWVDSFVPAAGGNTFEAILTPSVQQNVAATSGPTVVEFDTTLLDPAGAFDAGGFRWPVSAGEYWFFYAQVQLSEPSSNVTDLVAQLDIRRGGVATLGKSNTGYFANLSKGDMNVFASGLMLIGAENYVDVALTLIGTDAGAGGVDIDSNQTNTRFGGYRIL
jgi:hypothetical protein